MNGDRSEVICGEALGTAFTPISWVSSAVRYREDQNNIVLDGIKNGVGECATKTTSNVLFDDSPAIRHVQNALNCGLNLAAKRCT
jgi:hypothetical protein